MGELRTVIKNAMDLMEQDNRGVQLGCYTIAVAGLIVALRRVRPFSRFRKPNDIPKHFITERKELRGLVERIEPSGALLMVNHKPLVDIPLLPKGQLPVKVAGVNVSSLGVSWLQSVVAGHEVRFIPVATTPNSVQCEVRLQQQNRDGKSVGLNIGESLVKIGFGCVALDDVQNKSYLSQLEQAQNYALKKQLGIRYYLKPVKSALGAIGKQLTKAAFAAGKQLARSPKLVAS